MTTLSKSTARELGLARYSTGKPCKHGHVCERWVHNSVCLECCSANARRWARDNNQRNAANARAWRKNNPEKAKINQRRSNAKWLSKEENHTRKLEVDRERYVLNRELIRERDKARRLRDAEKIRDRNRAWYEKNKERAFALARNRKARLRNADGRHTAEEIAEIFVLQRGRCAYCRVALKTRKHVDHIIPLVLGGSNDRKNIQLLCPPCNLSKGPKHPTAFVRELGRLI